MLEVAVDPPVHGTVLLLGAHADDIEIGAGGTVLRLVETRPDLRFHWVVFAANEVREREARASAAAFLSGSPESEIEVLGLRESYFPYVGDRVKDAMEGVKSRVQPDLVLTHCLEDRHQDHRMISELTHNSFRDHLVLEYEIPKYDGDLLPTTIYSPLEERQIDRKCHLLAEHFPSQTGRPWFDADTFRGLARIRGLECNAPGRFAEGFRCRTLRLSLGASARSAG